jgi:phosphate transport system substrate-binding protein
VVITRSLAAAIALTLAACLASCTAGAYAPPASPANDAGRNDRATLLGAGATFPSIVYQEWFYDYHQDVAPGVKVNYQSVGSGAGIQQFIAGVVDFGATDAPMSDSDIKRAPDVQHIPTVMGAVVLTYSLPGLEKPLRLDGETAAALFLGNVTRWDDERIAALNPGVVLPALAVVVVHRSDSSGTSFVFTDWLTKVSVAWKAQLGANKAPAWPVGIGGQGNEGVTQVVAQTPGAIGYVELNYAITKKLAFADVRNRSGAFVTPTLESVAAAAAGAVLPDDYRVSITDAAGVAAYPISTFTFLLLHRNTASCAAARALVRVVYWAINDQEAITATRSLAYVPLPDSVVARVNETLRTLMCNGGTPVLG